MHAHCVRFAFGPEFAGHCRHDADPADNDTNPAPHSAHDVAPFVDDHVPIVQFTHAPPTSRVPGVHALHDGTPTDTEPDTTYPASHAHAVPFAVACVFGDSDAHDAHATDAASGAIVPAAHTLQFALASTGLARNVPVAHAVQLPSPPLSAYPAAHRHAAIDDDAAPSVVLPEGHAMHTPASLYCPTAHAIHTGSPLAAAPCCT